MTRLARRGGPLLAAALLLPPAAGAQEDSTYRTAPLYEGVAPIAVTLAADYGRLRRDRGDDPPWRAAVLSYAGEAGDTVRIPLRARARGIWRRNNCALPPLRLNFWKDSARGTLFDGVDEPKMVVHCRDTDAYEEYVLQELQLYRVYNLLTPFSHRVRLLRATYVEEGSGKPRATRWAFLMEEPKALAARVGARRTESKGGGPDDVDPYQHVLYAVFQYMIGNVDWSITALHNAELYFKDGAYVPVAYDFDYAGAVSTEYAAPPPVLRMASVRERRYRGYCVGEEHFAPVFALFNERREAIRALYADEVGRLLSPRTVERTLRYFDEFYETINDPRRARERIVERCIAGG